MNSISDHTRRAIIGCFTRDNKWAGSLGDADFLSRLYDLKKMPSKDARFDNAYRDIWQNRTYKDNWIDDWVFTDERFNLLTSPDDEFLKFLAETVHPQIRPDENAAAGLVEKFNQLLKSDGWEIFRKSDASDGNIYGARLIGSAIDKIEKPEEWKRVDKLIQDMRFILRTAVAPGDYHNIVLISQDTLESLAQAAIISQNPDLSTESLIETDAEASLKLLLENELKAEANKETLNYARAALKLALSLKGTNSFDRKTAALGVEALASLSNIVSVICEKDKI